jgi:hypothetical protein
MNCTVGSQKPVRVRMEGDSQIKGGLGSHAEEAELDP